MIVDKYGAKSELPWCVQSWSCENSVQFASSPQAPSPPRCGGSFVCCFGLGLEPRAPALRCLHRGQSNGGGCKKNAVTKAQASFVNVCLRRFLRERAELVARTDGDPVACWNHPQWWIDQLRREKSDRWQDILPTLNLQAPMSLRVNARQASRHAYYMSWLLAVLQPNPMAPVVSLWTQHCLCQTRDRPNGRTFLVDGTIPAQRRTCAERLCRARG